MIDGPFRAPSSPPEMPAPTKWIPVGLIRFSRAIVSWKLALPPSTMMSPGSKRSTSSSITASVPAPACTMMMAVRGFCSDATNSSMASLATKPASGCSPVRVSVRANVRLYTATVLPSRDARLRARLEPITARPTTPMLAFPAVDSGTIDSFSGWGLCSSVAGAGTAVPLRYGSRKVARGMSETSRWASVKASSSVSWCVATRDER